MSNKATLVSGVLGDGRHQGEWCGYEIRVGGATLKTVIGVRGRCAVVVTARGGEVTFVEGTIPSVDCSVVEHFASLFGDTPTARYSLTGLTLDQAVFVRRLLEREARAVSEYWGGGGALVDAAQALASLAAQQLPGKR